MSDTTLLEPPATGIIPLTNELTAFGASFNPTSLDIPMGVQRGDWEIIGRDISRFEQATQFWLGDWWIYGQRYGEYGDRVKAVSSDVWDDRGLPTFGTCANYATVCRAFERSSRRSELCFEHHKILAPHVTHPSLVQDLLDWCEEPLRNGKKRPRSVRELKEELDRRLNPVPNAAPVFTPPPQDPADTPGAPGDSVQTENLSNLAGSVPENPQSDPVPIGQTAPDDTANDPKTIKTYRVTLRHVVILVNRLVDADSPEQAIEIADQDECEYFDVRKNIEGDPILNHDQWVSDGWMFCERATLEAEEWQD
jgi:hypothetical protein